ncbi:MAG TPA: putative lipid II flippase FtsW [bacterium]|jgi:cell division protein FtsW|nr:putative lipid II flippase FtsW [bacterium]HOG38216.1 putative lipid II flippase FtsW [bacterium]HQI03194.1 putative lipid II flippase FtsW [bacterium]
MRPSRENKIQSFFRSFFRKNKSEHSPDYLIIIILWILVLFGLIVLLSASPVLSYKKYGNTYHIFWHQFLFGVLPGSILFYIFSKINFNSLKKYSFLMLLVSIILLVLVFVPGLGTDYGKDAQSWINIFGMSVQPSEIVKLTYLIYLAGWIESRGDKIKSFSEGFVPFIVLLVVICFLIFLEPDLGTLLIVFIIAITGFFIGGGSIKHILVLILSSFFLFLIAIKTAPYRLARLNVFLNPSSDVQGIAYHLNQSLIAIGSGGIFGVGLGRSRQKYGYIPEVSGDSIFAIIGEELGFIPCFIYILGIFVLIYLGFRVVSRTKSVYGKVLSAGIISWIGFQSFINICSMIGLMPMTGIPLPFVSYGGTAMIMSLSAMGILVNISKYTK